MATARQLPIYRFLAWSLFMSDGLQIVSVGQQTTHAPTTRTMIRFQFSTNYDVDTLLKSKSHAATRFTKLLQFVLHRWRDWREAEAGLGNTSLVSWMSRNHLHRPCDEPPHTLFPVLIHRQNARFFYTFSSPKKLFILKMSIFISIYFF